MDDVPLNALADTVGTPTWVYSAIAMRGRYRALTGPPVGRPASMRMSTMR